MFTKHTEKDYDRRLQFLEKTNERYIASTNIFYNICFYTNAPFVYMERTINNFVLFILPLINIVWQVHNVFFNKMKLHNITQQFINDKIKGDVWLVGKGSRSLNRAALEFFLLDHLKSFWDKLNVYISLFNWQMKLFSIFFKKIQVHLRNYWDYKELDEIFKRRYGTFFYILILGPKSWDRNFSCIVYYTSLTMYIDCQWQMISVKNAKKKLILLNTKNL